MNSTTTTTWGFVVRGHERGEGRMRRKGILWMGWMCLMMGWFFFVEERLSGRTSYYNLSMITTAYAAVPGRRMTTSIPEGLERGVQIEGEVDLVEQAEETRKMDRIFDGTWESDTKFMGKVIWNHRPDGRQDEFIGIYNHRTSGEGGTIDGMEFGILSDALGNRMAVITGIVPHRHLPCPLDLSQFKQREDPFRFRVREIIRVYEDGIIMNGFVNDRAERKGWMITPQCNIFHGMADGKGNFVEGEYWFELGNFFGTFFQNVPIPKEGKIIYTADKFRQRDTFEGEFYKNGQPMMGSLHYRNGAKYKGTFHMNGQLKEGVMEHKNGHTFQGMWTFEGRLAQYNARGKLFTGLFSKIDHEFEFGVIEEVNGKRNVVIMAVDPPVSIDCPLDFTELKQGEYPFISVSRYNLKVGIFVYGNGIMSGYEKANGERHGLIITQQCHIFNGMADANGKFIEGEYKFEEGYFSGIFDQSAFQITPKNGKMIYSGESTFEKGDSFEGTFHANRSPKEGIVRRWNGYVYEGIFDEDGIWQKGMYTKPNEHYFQGLKSKSFWIGRMHAQLEGIPDFLGTFRGASHKAPFGIVTRASGKRTLEISPIHIPCPFDPLKYLQESYTFEEDVQKRFVFNANGIMVDIEDKNDKQNTCIITPQCELFYGTVDGHGKFVKGDYWFEGGYFSGSFDHSEENKFAAGYLWMGRGNMFIMTDENGRPYTGWLRHGTEEQLSFDKNGKSMSETTKLLDMNSSIDDAISRTLLSSKLTLQKTGEEPASCEICFQDFKAPQRMPCFSGSCAGNHWKLMCEYCVRHYHENGKNDCPFCREPWIPTSDEQELLHLLESFDNYAPLANRTI